MIDGTAETMGRGRSQKKMAAKVGVVAFATDDDLKRLRDWRGRTSRPHFGTDCSVVSFAGVKTPANSGLHWFVHVNKPLVILAGKPQDWPYFAGVSHSVQQTAACF